jgi:O-antigen/teichoic acid export membrane protein
MRSRTVLLVGAAAGLIGAVMVAVWFLAYDFLRDTPFQTPSLLGAALFDRLSQAAPVETSTRLVSQYTIVHGLAFIVLGCALAGLFAIADRDFRFLFAIFMLLCCFQVAFLALLVVLAEWLLDPIPWWAIVIGNVFATIGMLGVLLPRHRPALRRYARTGLEEPA